MFLGGLFFEWIQTVLILAGYVSGNATFPKPLNKSEEKKYLDLYAKGDESAKNVLIEHNLRLVAHIAKKYADEKNLEDLISIGTIGLIKGINTFNPEKNSRLSTYISRCIEKTIRSQRLFLNNKRKFQPPISEAGTFYGKLTAICIFSIAIERTEQFSCPCISILSDC